MNDRPDHEQDARAGLCARCRHARLVVSDRGGRFILCERSQTDPGFARFPPLPVVRCRGCETEDPSS
jgi:hypothetical protein